MIDGLERLAGIREKVDDPVPPRCPKCGNGDVHVRYEKEEHFNSADWCRWPDGNHVEGEHFDAYCRFCSYGWALLIDFFRKAEE